MRFPWKKIIHIQINSVVSLINDVVLSIYSVVSPINSVDLDIDADKNKFSSRNDNVSIAKREWIWDFQKKVVNECEMFSFAMSQADFFWTTLASINAKSAMNFSVSTSFCFSLIDCIKFSFVSIILFFFSDFIWKTTERRKWFTIFTFFFKNTYREIQVSDLQY